jgi:hypothetical protein
MTTHRPRASKPVDGTLASITMRGLQSAKRAFRVLGREAQFLLAQEVVQTRERELRLAYPDLVGIGFGFKTKRTASGRGARLVRTPCVIFEVERKRKLARASESVRKLPPLLFAYMGEPGSRRLCAVPTDVKESAAFGKPEPHDGSNSDIPFGIVVNGKTSEADGVAGTIACAVTRSSDPGQVYAISCRHVLSRSLIEDPDIRAGCRVDLGSMPGPLLGKTAKARGVFVSAPASSFDAQLVRISDKDALSMALAGLKFDPDDPVLTGPERIPNGFWVATPRADSNNRRLKVWVTFIDWPKHRAMAYHLPAGDLQVAHTLVIHGVAKDTRLEPGDSGSPAILVNGGGRLIGMYLGGDGLNAYFIPGWQLFLPRNFGLPSETPWSLRNV